MVADKRQGKHETDHRRRKASCVTTFSKGERRKTPTQGP